MYSAKKENAKGIGTFSDRYLRITYKRYFVTKAFVIAKKDYFLRQHARDNVSVHNI